MKKLILLFTIVCAGQLYAMEQASYMAELPKEVQLLIIQNLMNGNDLDTVINGIKTASKTTLNKTVNELYGNPAGFRDLVQTLAKKFPKVKTDYFAAKKFQEVDTEIIAKKLGTTAAMKYIDLSNELINHIKFFPYYGTDEMIQNALNEIIQLINQGADVNYTGESDHFTPLMHATNNQKPRIKVIKLLLDYGANPNTTTKHDQGAIHLLHGTYPELDAPVKKLLKEAMEKESAVVKTMADKQKK